MSRQQVNNQLSHLQRQIADVVARIKNKRQAKDSGFEADVYELNLRPLSKVENYAYKLVDAGAEYSLLGKSEPTDSKYAANTYKTVDKTDGKPSVVEGLVFENNREFDFRV